MGEIGAGALVRGPKLPEYSGGAAADPTEIGARIAHVQANGARMRSVVPLPRLVVASIALAAGAAASAGDWAEWRGPARDGRSSERGLPTAWSPAGQNLAWKAPYGSRSTPIVVGDRVCLQNGAGAGADLQERVLCLNADTGKLLWEHRFNVYHSDVPPHRIGWPSPAADPATGNVYAFGVGGTLLSLDPAGKVLWERSVVEDFGLVTTHGGRTVSPVIDGDLVIVSGIAAGWGDLARAGHRFLAFDKKTGATVYVSSPGGRPFDTTYSPPIIGEVNGVRLLIAGGSDGAMHAIKPQTGEPVWNFLMSKRGLNTGALLSNGVAIVSHSEENYDSSEMGLLAGIDAAGKGALKAESVRWSVKGFQGGFSSPVLDGDRFYQVDNGANLVAFDATSGKQLWLHNLGTIQKASPVLADGKLYVGTENGKFFILKPGPTGAEVLDEDWLGSEQTPEQIIASVAVSRGRIFLATMDNLYCIGKKAAGPADPKPAPLPAGKAPATHLQVSPTELALTPGDRVQLTARLFDAQGRLIREEKAAKWELTGLEGAVSPTGRLTTAGTAAQAGSVKATVGELSGSARVRVIPALPWKWDFETGAVPPQWINATGKFAVREEGGAKVLVKLADNPFTKRARVFMGGGHLANYTVEADALAHEQRRQMGDVGVVAQRYQLVLFGNSQKIELQSWQPETMRTVHQAFPWKAETWYRLKLRVDTEAGGVRARGKAWPASDPEPEAWTLERLDPHPNRHGSPGLYADAPYEVTFDNVRVTANGAADAAAAKAAADRAAEAAAPKGAPASPADLFAYDATRPLDVRETGVVAKDGVTVRDITYGADGRRTAAYLVSPSAEGKSRPAALFVHWYEPQSKDSNRTQFLEQARTLAARGAVSLLVETMWSDPAWFRARDSAKDYDHSVEQVRALRRALDVLLARPDVDPARVAYVGHDFGAMYGAVLAGVDPRVTAGVALQAGTTSFADWFLISAKLQGEAREKFVERLSPLDPVHFVGQAKAPVYFQFATSDPYVSKANADAFYAAAREPKEIRWYEGGHGLSPQAVADRQEWLIARLGLGQRASGASK
jgi:outer membrane protein assembly factor BamB/dienelactone hydrolase